MEGGMDGLRELWGPGVRTLQVSRKPVSGDRTKAGWLRGGLCMSLLCSLLEIIGPFQDVHVCVHAYTWALVSSSLPPCEAETAALVLQMRKLR